MTWEKRTLITARENWRYLDENSKIWGNIFEQVGDDWFGTFWDGKEFQRLGFYATLVGAKLAVEDAVYPLLPEETE